MTRPFLLFLLLAAAAAGLVACGDDDSASAGSDDALVVYSGRNQDLVGELLRRYQADTGRKLKVRYGESPDMAATLIEEGDRSPADVFLSQDAGALGAVQKEGLLTALPSGLLGEVDERFRSSQGQWIGLTARARVIAYDKREYEASDMPRSVLELTDPEWKGKVGWAPTNASFETFVTALRKLEGDDGARKWLEGMIENDTKPFPNNIAVRDAIANGEVDLGLINHYYVAEAVAKEGADYPVGLYHPPAGDPGSLVNVSGAGILASSERQEQARQLLEYLLGRTGQEYFARTLKEYPVAAGVEPDPGLKPLDEIQQPDLDLSDLDDLQATVKLIQDTGAL